MGHITIKSLVMGALLLAAPSSQGVWQNFPGLIFPVWERANVTRSLSQNPQGHPPLTYEVVVTVPQEQNHVPQAAQGIPSQVLPPPYEAISLSEGLPEREEGPQEMGPLVVPPPYGAEGRFWGGPFLFSGAEGFFSPHALRVRRQAPQASSYVGVALQMLTLGVFFGIAIGLLVFLRDHYGMYGESSRK